jgi:hypothetical protein
MVLPVRIRTVNDRDPELSKRAHSRIMRASMLAVGFKWAWDLLPEHFDKTRQAQFGYAPRTRDWKKKKARLFLLGLAVEPDTDLVFTGRLRNMVLHSARNNIRAFPSRCRVTMFGPKYFTLRAQSRHTRRLADEVLAMSPRHRTMLTAAADSGFKDAYRAELQARRMRKTTITS